MILEVVVSENAKYARYSVIVLKMSLTKLQNLLHVSVHFVKFSNSGTY